eukprot:9062416-Heterocapsa_arctica.AAC.1
MGKGAPADPSAGGQGFMNPGQMGKGAPARGPAAAAHNQGLAFGPGWCTQGFNMQPPQQQWDPNMCGQPQHQWAPN